MLKKLFGFDPTKTTIKTEIIAGITTFLTMSYILAVDPDIFGAIKENPMPGGAVFTATALAAIIGYITMAFIGKLPFGLAPGMGLLMIEPIKKIPFSEFTESIPAFICIIMMPLTYSISHGILLGMISYVVINMLCGKFKKITATMYILAVLFILKYIFL